MQQKAEVGAFNSVKSNDATQTLNAIVGEGWELVTGSFVFVVQGEESGGKFMSSGQNVAVKGEPRAYYLFKRNESNRAS